MQGALARQSGVSQARVDFDRKQARVTYDPKVTNPQKIIAGLQATHGGRYTAVVKK